MYDISGISDAEYVVLIPIKELDKRYYADDRTSSFTIFYDAKTMLPLLPPEDQVDVTFETATEDNPGEFKIKLGTIYYKWTRTIKRKEEFDDSILGRTFVINADTEGTNAVANAILNDNGNVASVSTFPDNIPYSLVASAVIISCVPYI